MSDTKQQIDLMEELDDIEAYNGKWVALYTFNDKGAETTGRYYDSLEKIEEAINWTLGRHKRSLKEGYSGVQFPNISTYGLKTIIPMPSGDA